MKRVDSILHALSPRKATLSSDTEEQHVLRYDLYIVLRAQGWNEYTNESIPLSLDKINEKLNELKQDEAAPAPNQPGSSSRLT